MKRAYSSITNQDQSPDPRQSPEPNNPNSPSLRELDTISLHSSYSLDSEMSAQNSNSSAPSNSESNQLTITQKCVNFMPTFQEAKSWTAAEIASEALKLCPAFSDAKLRNDFYTAFLQCIRTFHYPRFLSTLSDCLRQFYEEKLQLTEAFDHILHPRNSTSPGTPTESENPVHSGPSKSNSAPLGLPPVTVFRFPQQTPTMAAPMTFNPNPNPSARLMGPPPVHPLISNLYENVLTVLRNQQEIMHQLSEIQAYMKKD